MNSSYPPLMAIGVLVASAPAALAQTPLETAQGPASALPAGFVLRDGAGAIRVNPSGSTGTPVPVWSTTAQYSGPDYRHAQLFGQNEAHVEVDAISTGNDVIPRPATMSGAMGGIPELLGVGRWLGVVISVKEGTSGEAGSLVTRAMNNGRRNGSDLFSYYFAESLGIATSVAGENLVEESREAMGYAWNDPQDIAGLDYGLGVRAFDPGMTTDPMFPTEDSYYFSVTAASAIDLNQAFGGFKPVEYTGTGPFVPVPADCRTIYKLEWSGTQWFGPIVYRDGTTLGMAPEDDLDAVAVDPFRGTTVYSTVIRPGGQDSQMMFHDSVFGATTVPLRNNAPADVSDAMGLGDTADIDAICILDPKEIQHSTYFGTPVGELAVLGTNGPMGLSITRVRPIADSDLESVEDFLSVQLSGHRGNIGDTSNVIFMKSVRYDTGYDWDQNTWDLLGGVVRHDDGTNFDNVMNYHIPINEYGGDEYMGLFAIVFSPAGAIIGASTVCVIRE